MRRGARFTAVLAVACAAVGAGCVPMLALRRVPLASARPGATTFHGLRVGRANRTFLLHLPPTRHDSAAPLVLVFHGNHANASTVRKEANLEHAADSLGVVVAYLNGSGWMGTTNLTWNDGACCGYARSHHADDVAFARVLVDTLVRAVHVDRRRVYLAGLSAGGTVALRIACEADTPYAGVASVAGTMPVQPCEPKQRLSVMFMRGAEDHELARDHAENGRLGARSYATSFPASRAFWAAQDGCAATIAVDSTPGAVITRSLGCPAGLEVEDVVVSGQGHAWPGGRKPIFFAPTPAPYDAATLMLDFFVRSRPTP